jgi:hypothetical protein
LKYEVVILPRAKIQLYNSALWWAEHRSQRQAADWLAGFEAAIESLSDTADHQPISRESGAFPFVVRQLNYGLGKFQDSPRRFRDPQQQGACLRNSTLGPTGSDSGRSLTPSRRLSAAG